MTLKDLVPGGLIEKPVHSCEGRMDATSNDGEADEGVCARAWLVKAAITAKVYADVWIEDFSF